MAISLGELATKFDCELVGDENVTVDNVAALDNADSSSLSFLSNPALKQQLATTAAAAVILRAEDAEDSPTAALINDNPYACYARMAALIHPAPTYEPGTHSSAQVSATANVAASAHVAANVIVGDRVTIGEHTYIGPGCVIGPDCDIGNDCRLVANVTFVRNVSVGARCIFHPGTVIGADGFGNAMTPEGWVKIPQFGGVQIGNDVEIGANTTIDCGAIDDTVLEDGVRIDNLVMIGHNTRIGAHTAMAAMSAVAGSCVIGKRCMFAGMSGTAGHTNICDDVVFSGKCMISKDIKEPGVYSSDFPAQPVRDWNRNVARFRRLGQLSERVSKLEKDKS